MTILPMKPTRSAIMRSSTPTLAAKNAHATICASRARAARSPAASVGLPPRKRIMAQATSAELKNTMTK